MSAMEMAGSVDRSPSSSQCGSDAIRSIGHRLVSARSDHCPFSIISRHQNEIVPSEARGSLVRTMSLPSGAMATAANLKLATPSGIPMMVRHSRKPVIK